MSRCLKAEGVAFAYESGADVFHDVSAAVASGGVTGIVGPNGSGKSTLLRVLCGLLKPHAGRVLLDGAMLDGLSSIERARVVGFLPQSVDPVFVLSAFEVVCLGRYPRAGPLAGLRPHDKEVAARCMRDTETEGLRDRDFSTLSGGERQRVLLASILAQEPELLLLDEPTSALDIHHQVHIFVLLRQLAAEGYGVGVVTHDLNHAAQFCDNLFLLGERTGLVASGAPEAVLTEKLLSSAYAAPIQVADHPITHTPLVCAEVPEARSR